MILQRGPPKGPGPVSSIAGRELDDEFMDILRATHLVHTHEVCRSIKERLTGAREATLKKEKETLLRRAQQIYKTAVSRLRGKNIQTSMQVMQGLVLTMRGTLRRFHPQVSWPRCAKIVKVEMQDRGQAPKYA